MELEWSKINVFIFRRLNRMKNELEAAHQMSIYYSE